MTITRLLGTGAHTGTEPLLHVDGLTVGFAGRRRAPWRARPRSAAVTDLSLRLDPGHTLGLVGESGSGKTTTARAILRLVRPDAGRISAGGFRVDGFGARVPRAYRRAVQAVFQDPLGSLDPSMTIGDILAEPLLVHRLASGRAVTDRVGALLDQVGLAARHRSRYTYELSGGQRQRVAIAKALAVEPRLIVLDEPVSALDVSVQSQVVNLLETVQESTGVGYMFVAHDLAVVRHTCERITVMYRSRVVEEGPADRVCEQPAHPYTRSLLAAAPDPDPATAAARRERRRELTVAASGPSPDPAQACPFAPRCPLRLPECTERFPAWTAVAGGGRVACHARPTGPGED